ncbi:MAG: 50S ribosomal protein L29 [Candidatus Paceibacterota bacterium]|jgi:ribosomal protein L29|nr:50S ribosomal protein L29 [Candidatus Paceibacterota bacterium]MDD4830783.1 50S ribosomal protein L29 [Candidatus Paceibacterota bacterium]MDD4875295.1 50S ribosomal protein L29 [Candidatus Paceibacterota bacterium]
MKTAELKQKNKEELLKLLDEKKRDVQNLKMQLASGKIKSVKGLKETKKDIAKIFTLLNKESENLK